jgi:hypothetical protein
MFSENVSVNAGIGKFCPRKTRKTRIRKKLAAENTEKELAAENTEKELTEDNGIYRAKKNYFS